MFRVWQALTIVLVSVGMALSLAYVLELPGKRRLGRATYFAVQTIYYPGFTIGGAFGEFGAIIATLVLVAATPFGTDAFWSTLVATVSLLTMHATYWVWTHPVNKIWMRDRGVEGVGARFFAAGWDRLAAQDWTQLRDRWEYSHVARAAFAMVALIALVVAALTR